MKFVFFSVSENGENDEGADGAMPLQNFWARTAPGFGTPLKIDGLRCTGNHDLLISSFSSHKDTDTILWSIEHATSMTEYDSVKQPPLQTEIFVSRRLEDKK